jgi:heme/copper-type cytochrome/quinol oxidase subunit 2
MFGDLFGGNQNQNNASDTEIKITQDDLGLGGAPTSFGDAEIGLILGLVYTVAGVAAVIVIIIGGIRYATSNGDSSGMQTAKNTILYAVVGLIVIIMAAAITAFVINSVGEGSGGGAGDTTGTPQQSETGTVTPGEQ